MHCGSNYCISDFLYILVFTDRLGTEQGSYSSCFAVQFVRMGLKTTGCPVTYVTTVM